MWERLFESDNRYLYSGSVNQRGTWQVGPSAPSPTPSGALRTTWGSLVDGERLQGPGNGAEVSDLGQTRTMYALGPHFSLASVTLCPTSTPLLHGVGCTLQLTQYGWEQRDG